MVEMIELDAIDQKLLRAVRQKPSTVTLLAQKTGVKAGTVAYRLAKLKRRRLIQSRKGKGVENMWETSTASVQTKNPITIYRGNDILRAYALLKRLPKRSIVYTIEGADFLRRNLRTLSMDTIADIQRSYRRRHIVLKGVVHERFLEYTTSSHDQLAEIHKGRTMAYVSRKRHQSLLGSSMHVVTSSLYMVFNEKKRYAVVIRDPDMANMLHEILHEIHGVFEYADDVGKTDFNKVAEKILAAKVNRKR